LNPRSETELLDLRYERVRTKGGIVGSRNQEERLGEIEKTQAALRDNIAESQRLIDKSQQLIEQHRHDLKGEARA
jgi:hypothetical protein